MARQSFAVALLFGWASIVFAAGPPGGIRPVASGSHPTVVTNLVWLPNGKAFALTDWRGSVTIYSRGLARIRRLGKVDRSGAGSPLGVSPDGRFVAGRVGTSVRLWKVATGEQVAD